MNLGRKEPALNKSYAKLVSKNFSEAAVSLRDKLVDMGFEEGDAEANIEAEHLELDYGLFARHSRPHPTMTMVLDATEDERKEIGTVAPSKIKVSEGDNGKTRIEFTGVLRPRDEARLYEMSPTRLHYEIHEKLEEFKAGYADEIAPAQMGEEFTVPRLMAHVQGELVFGDTDILMEYHDWSLADHPARLTKYEFDIVETTSTFEIDLDGNHLSISAADSSEHLFRDIEVEDWTQNALVSWLDGKVRDQWISQTDLLAWLNDIVTYLTRDRGIPLSQLMRCKFILARKLNEKIRSFSQEERNTVYQMNLFGPEAQVRVSFDEGIRFFDDMYFDVPKYRGTFKFNNHFMGPDDVPTFDSKDGGEEVKCALALDTLPGLKYWTRNVSRHPNSFSLPTSTDKFYPDFVAVMQDGRLLVVEYKGKDRTPQESRDSREKELIGQQWAKASEGKAVFVMTTMEHGDVNEVKTQVLRALSK